MFWYQNRNQQDSELTIFEKLDFDVRHTRPLYLGAYETGCHGTGTVVHTFWCFCAEGFVVHQFTVLLQ